MKKLLNITLLIIAVLLGSCKEESSVSRIEKGTTKKVKALSYTFNSTQNEDGGTVKSGTSTDSTKAVSPIERKVISVETWEAGGEMFVASLIEENDPIATKAPTQEVNGSSVYTFYAYKDSKIKQQTVAPKGTFDVPVDEATNYGMIFLSSANGMENPNTITSPTINESKKEITYKATFNENVCYASFDKVKMPPGNPIDVTFTPVFSQLGIYVPSKVTGTTITVEKVRLVSGGQQEATVKVVYNSNATNNIDVTYNDNLANYAVDLTHKLNPTDNITYLYPNGKQGYYNIIPNNNPAQVYIKLTAAGITKPMEKTIEFKNTASKPISFSSGKRYTIKIENGITPHIEITPADNINLVSQSYTLGETIVLKYGLTQQLKAIAVYPNGTREDITKDAGTTWGYVGTEDGQTQITGGASVDNTDTDKKGLVTLIKVGTSKITATYKGGTGTATIKPDIHRIFKATDYYQWDAYMPYDINNPNGTTPPWGPGSSSFHSGDGVKPVTDKFKSTPTNNETMKYLGNGCNFSATDGLIYTVEPDGTSGKKLYCSGAWFKKSAYWSASATPTNKIESSPQGRPTVSEAELNEMYFYLPLCSFYNNGKFLQGELDGNYWLRDSYNSHIVLNGIDYELSYSLRIFPSGRIILLGLGGSTSYNRNSGLVPLEGFDDSSVPATVKDITISPNPLNIEPGDSGKLTATVTMSNGSTPPTTDFTWVINSPNGVVTSTDGGVVVLGSDENIVTGSSTTNEITLFSSQGYYGSTTVKVTYGGKSATAAVNVYRNFKQSNYYMWDAPVDEPYNYPTENYNDNKDAKGVATQSCANAPTVYELQRYLAAGVYWVTDGPPYKMPINGVIYRTGLMVKQKAYIPGFADTKLNDENEFIPSEDFTSLSSAEKAQYFFLPACGEYGIENNTFIYPDYGYYWTSTSYYPDEFWSGACALKFTRGSARVEGLQLSGFGFKRNAGMVPMPKL